MSKANTKKASAPVKIPSKLKKGDKVQVIAGTDKDKQGTILQIDRKKNRVIIEGVNMVSKHMKQGAGEGQQGGIIKKEAPVHASNVMYLHNGKPSRLGYQVEVVEKDGKRKVIKHRVARPSGDKID